MNQLFGNTDTVEDFKKSQLKKLFCLASKESNFIFDSLLYKQTDGVAMGSSLGPSLANAFLSYHEKKKLVKKLSTRISKFLSHQHVLFYGGRKAKPIFLS